MPAANKVFRSANRGLTWEAVGGDLTSDVRTATTSSRWA